MRRLGGQMYRRRIVWVLALIFLATSLPQGPAAQAAPQSAVAAATVPGGFEDLKVADVFLPTALEWLPDGHMLVTTQPGQLKVYNGGSFVTNALDLSDRICSNSERGLLGVAVDPAYTTTKHIFLFYTANTTSACRNRVSRFTMSGNIVVSGSERILLTADPASAGNHNGGDLHFGKDGTLYISLGDGGCDPYGGGCAGSNNAARDRNSLFGKILRINKDGSIPGTNPYIGSNSARCNVSGNTSATWCRETFAWGLRNPFRFAMDPNSASIRFFINDVGQNRWEEVDNGVKGADYGWSCREGNYDNPEQSCSPTSGARGPILNYSHDGGCASITGGAFVPNGLWPGLNGSYLYADYVCGKIFRRTATGAISTFVSGLGSSSAVHMAFGPLGSGRALYYTTYEGGGEIRRIRYAGTSNRAPVASLKASPTYGLLPLAVTFDASASRDPEGGALTYAWDFNSDGVVDSRSSKPMYTYRSSRNFTAKLTVRDVNGAVDSATTTIYAGNTPPTPKITAPSTTKLFRVGESISLQGTATDAQEGTLAGARLTWRVIKVHATHTHPFASPTVGASTSITAPPPEDLAATSNSYLRLQLTATDARGLSQTITQRLNPHTVSVTLKTSPTGLKLGINGRTIVAPATVTSWQTYGLRVSAPPQYDSAGRYMVFSRWSDGRSAAHTIVTPASAATYTATYKVQPTLTHSASSTLVQYDGPTTLTGHLRSSTTTLAQRTVTVWRSLDGGRTWLRDGLATYNATRNRYTATRRLTRNAHFQMRYDGNTTYASDRSNVVSVLSKASLTRPVTPDTVSRNVSFTTYGYLKPYHAGSTALFFRRYVNGTWTYYGAGKATNTAFDGYTLYTLSGYSLPYAGSWKVRANHSDGSHAATYGPWRYFTVK